jgi:SOS-response transcriptional repressor LexA
VTEPTKRQREVLRVIHRSVMLRGHSPTYRELCEALNVSSKNAVNDHLSALENKGMIIKRPGECRGLILTDLGCNALEYLSAQEQIRELEDRIARIEDHLDLP